MTERPTTVNTYVLRIYMSGTVHYALQIQPSLSGALETIAGAQAKTMETRHQRCHQVMHHLNLHQHR